MEFFCTDGKASKHNEHEGYFSRPRRPDHDFRVARQPLWRSRPAPARRMQMRHQRYIDAFES